MNSILSSTDSQGVATLRLNRPDLHNAIDDEMASALTQALNDAAQDPAVRVVVLTGNGINFSAGHDMAWLQRMASASLTEAQQQVRLLGQMLLTLDTLPKPTIARVQGSAFGIGAGLIACCDLAYGVPEALFSFPDVRLGAVPAVVAPFVMRSLGARAARRYFVSAERFSAGKARRLGLLHHVVDDDELDAVIARQVHNLLANGPHAMHAAKQLLAELAEQPDIGAALELAIARAASVRTSDEGREGLAAFIEKRQPRWYA